MFSNAKQFIINLITIMFSLFLFSACPANVKVIKLETLRGFVLTNESQYPILLTYKLGLMGNTKDTVECEYIYTG